MEINENYKEKTTFWLCFILFYLFCVEVYEVEVR